MPRRAILPPACLAVSLGCAAAPPEGPPDATADVSPDATADVSPDTRDVSPDTRDVPSDVPSDAGPAEPDFAAIPWDSPGYGVFHRDARNPRGGDVFIAYAGYNIDAAAAQAWAARLYTDALRARGVRHVYAVQGPRDPGYDALEIGNSRLAADLLPRVSSDTRILVAAHSSGAFVAHELLGQLYARGLDPAGITRGRVSYWDLDGGSAGLTPAIVSSLRHAWFVWASTLGVASPNAGTMRAAGTTYAAAGGALPIVADASGCRVAWCVHMVLINEHPRDPDHIGTGTDYASFDAAHPVATAWLARTNYGAP